MIVVNPPVVKPYAPATQPIASVLLVRTTAAWLPGSPRSKQLQLVCFLFDANGKSVNHDRSQVRKMTADEIAAFLGMPAVAGDTDAQDLARRALPYVNAAYGLNGVVSV
jgi:hypothetical protein